MEISNIEWITELRKFIQTYSTLQHITLLKLAKILLDDEISTYTIAIPLKLSFPPEGNPLPKWYNHCMHYCDSVIIPITMSHGTPQEQILGEGQNERLYEKGVCEPVWSSLRLPEIPEQGFQSGTIYPMSTERAGGRKIWIVLLIVTSICIHKLRQPQETSWRP